MRQARELIWSRIRLAGSRGPIQRWVGPVALPRDLPYRDQAGAAYINAMDDAGLTSLCEAKLAYRPTAVNDNWVITGF